MKRDDLREYLPTDETIRRVMDPVRAEETFRRAMESVQHVQLDRMAEQGAAPAADAAPAAKPERKRWPWWMVLGAALSPVAPAVLVYWLLVPHGSGEGAEAPREVPPTLR
jgi:hypothetical protein